MKKQCNLCGVREDSVSLGQINRTWCLVLQKEVENKQPGCEHWCPDNPGPRQDRLQVAAEIRRQNQESLINEEMVEQRVLDRATSEKTARKAFIISIISALVAMASCVAAWLALLKAR